MLWWTLHRLKSSSSQTRTEAAARLGNSREKKAAPALIEALGDESAPVRLAVLHALAEIRHAAAAEPLAHRLVRLAQQSKARRAGAQPYPAETEYAALARALGVLGSAAVPPLLRLLDADEQEARRWAAHALGLARDPQALEPLSKRLSDSRSEVRKEAALALGGIGDARALGPLVTALAHRDPETRRAAAAALGALGSDQAVGPLRSLCEDPHEPVLLAVIEALRRIGGLRAGAVLRAVIDSGRKNVREPASAALSSIDFAPANAGERASAAALAGDFAAAIREGEEAVGVLIETLASKDARRRQQAAEALAQLRSPHAVTPLLGAIQDHDAGVQDAAARALAATGTAALEGLIGLLAHHDAAVQRFAARSLGEIGDPGAASALAGAIRQNRIIPKDYPEALDVVRASASALEAILARSASIMSTDDLRRAGEVPDAVPQEEAVGMGEAAVDCARIREVARQELQRRT